MPLRSRHTVALALFASSLAACALQTTGLGPRDDGDTDAGASGAVDASAESSSSSDASTSDAATWSADAVAPDTSTTTPDASSSADAGDGGPCDKDNDGHRDVGNVCLGDDCCDVDSLVHPGQTDFFATRNACGTFDYDCNGSESVERGNVNCKLGFFACSGDGFAATTACGVTATYTSCGWAGFSCSHNDDMRAQRCR